MVLQQESVLAHPGFLVRLNETISTAEVPRGDHAALAALSPFLSREPQASEYAEVAKVMQIRENSVAVAVHRLRQQYRQVVRCEVAAGLNDPALVDEELRHLAASL